MHNQAPKADPNCSPRKAWIRPRRFTADDHITQRSRLKRLGWGLTYVGLLGFTLAIVTYALPIGTISILLAILGIFLSRVKIRLPAFLLMFGGLILWSLVGYLSTAYPATVYAALDAAIRIWVISFVAVNALRTPAQLRFYLIFFLACFAMYPTRGAIFNYVGGYTVFGRVIWNHIFSNPNDLAALTFLPLSIAAVLFMTERNQLFRWGALVSIVVLPVLILMTQSRGAFIALVIVALLTITWQRNRARILLAVGALVLAAALLVPSDAWQRLSGISSLTSTDTLVEANDKGSADARFHIWKTAVLIIKDHPVTGVGLGAYAHAHESYAAFVPGSPEAQADVHSTYLWILATTGIPGFILFVSILATLFIRAERARSRLGRAAPKFASMMLYLELGLLAYLLAGLFGSFALLTFLYLHLALVWVTAEIGEAELRRIRQAAELQAFRSISPAFTTGLGAVTMRPQEAP